MEDMDRLAQINKEQTAELLKQLTPDETIAFYNLDEFDEFLEKTSHLDAPVFAQLAKIVAREAMVQANAEAAEERAEAQAFAQLPASDKFSRRARRACSAMGWGVGLVTWATDGSVVGLHGDGLLLGIGAGCATYGVSRLAVLAICEVTRRREKGADRPANAAAATTTSANDSIGAGPAG